MSEVKISETDDAPADGEGRLIKFEHPVTDILYELALYRSGDRYFCLADACKLCGSSLVRGGPLNGMYARCVMEGHPWHIKTGLCKFDRRQSLPTYRVQVRDDGLYIEI
jgi:nitrite reductase/ring-hydroxylating ferredoxin subunit